MSPLLEVDGLVKHFPARGGARCTRSTTSRFTVDAGETLGLVGESGSGKSTVARLVVRLLEPDRRRHPGRRRPTSRTSRAGALRALRRRVQIVFQDPYSSLDPRMTARAIVSEPLRIAGRNDEIRTPRARGAATGRARVAEHERTLPARAVRRSTSARRDRPRARGRTRAARARRAGHRARRVDPGADPQPARGPAGAARPRVPVHRPRPCGRAPPGRSRRRDAPRAASSRRRPPPTLFARACAPVHPGVAVGVAGARSRRRNAPAGASC